MTSPRSIMVTTSQDFHYAWSKCIKELEVYPKIHFEEAIDKVINIIADYDLSIDEIYYIHDYIFDSLNNIEYE